MDYTYFISVLIITSQLSPFDISPVQTVSKKKNTGGRKSSKVCLVTESLLPERVDSALVQISIKQSQEEIDSKVYK